MPGRVLVVEDSAAVRGLIVVILERAGYEVVATADAASALEAGDGFSSPDLVICDVHLSGQSGIGVCDQLRSRNPGLKILYMSGQNVPLPSSHESAFLLKPFRPEALVAKVREMTGK